MMALSGKQYLGILISNKYREINLLQLRYEKCWIPFISANSPDFETDKDFSPPVDVRWVWNVHMLAPGQYAEDLQRSVLGEGSDCLLVFFYILTLIGRIINHEPRSPEDKAEEEKMKKTEKLWNLQFPEEPYKPSNIQKSKYDEDFISSFLYDIVAASQRQQTFFYQVKGSEGPQRTLILLSKVSLPHYQDETFLRNAVTRYAMYLQLQLEHPDKFLVPCYDMDIVWHTHQVYEYCKF